MARGHLDADTYFYTGKIGSNDGDYLPFPVTAEVLARGQQRFNIYCSPCHGEVGDGNGMIVQRGFKHPPSYHIERLRKAPIGYFFDVMTNGYGAMPDYAQQVPPADRWAIAAYIRALQLSQHATEADVPAGKQIASTPPAGVVIPPPYDTQGPRRAASQRRSSATCRLEEASRNNEQPNCTICSKPTSPFPPEPRAGRAVRSSSAFVGVVFCAIAGASSS